MNLYRLREVLDRLIGPSRAVQTNPKIVVREVVPGRDIERVPEQREVVAPVAHLNRRNDRKRSERADQ